MSAQQVEIKTEDGVANCQFFSPTQSGKFPAVVLYMDAFGLRPALCGMAERLAFNGYSVLLPNLYYRSGPFKPFDPKTAFNGGLERNRLNALYQSINIQLMMRDTANFLNFLERQPSVEPGKFGCVGYCMGGPFALSVAGFFPERVAAAASFHGGRLATDQPDSPHLLAPKMRAEIYVGIADIDPHFTVEERQRLEAALQLAGVRHKTEVYAGAKHGFAVTDTAAYDEVVSEQHWQRLFQLFAGNLRRQ